MLLLLLSCLRESVVELLSGHGHTSFPALPTTSRRHSLSAENTFPVARGSLPTTTVLCLRPDVSWSITNSLPMQENVCCYVSLVQLTRFHHFWVLAATVANNICEHILKGCTFDPLTGTIRLEIV